MSDDTFKTRKTLTVAKQQFDYFSLPAAEQAGVGAVSRLPMSLKILLENLLRFEDGNTVRKEDIKALGNWAVTPPPAVAMLSARVAASMVRLAPFQMAPPCASLGDPVREPPPIALFVQN